MTNEQLELEINHILDSGANSIRLIELFNRFASLQNAELKKENAILKELNSGKLLAYDAMSEALEESAIKRSELQSENAELKKENEILRRKLEDVLDKINREKKAWDAEHGESDPDTTKAFIRGARCSVNEIKEFVDNNINKPTKQ